MPLPPPEILKPFHERIRAVYEKMNEAYDRVQAHYGLTCEGCQDNCCTQRFFHYTVAEYVYLREGVRGLDPERRAQAIMRAKEVTDAYAGELEAGELRPLMCPLNFDGLCGVYAHRPMICRTHGLPHGFRRPDGAVHEGGGCHRFEAGHDTIDERIDRTEFYMELAGIERDLRTALGISGKYMKTTAQMLMDIARELEEEGEGQSQT
jgi:Fe-S-cluster containining protein